MNHQRISTGNPEADEILGGGVPENSLNIIMGQPGTGKTIFAQQLVFHNSGGDRPILYLTTLSEPVAKVVRYVQGMSFYDEQRLGTQIVYQDAGQTLAREGLPALLDVIGDAIERLNPKIVLIDSFKALHDLTMPGPEVRRVFYELTGLLTAYQTTAFLVGEYTDEDSRTLPEFAIADGIVQLLRSSTDTRDERFFRVLKLRGSNYREGHHAFKITGSGLQIYPRLVSPEVVGRYDMVQERTPSGVPGLDALLGGGFWIGATTLLAGITGGGKTTMGLQFALQGLENGESSLVVNFQENPTQLSRTLRNLGLEPETARERGLHTLYVSPVELQIDSLVVAIFRYVHMGVKRVVIDALGDLMAAAADPQRIHNYLYALTQHFAVSGVTSILTFETEGGVTAGGPLLGGRFSFMCDNIIFLNLEAREKVKRTLVVLKARGTAHALDVHEIEIGVAGARVK